ncbi:hypothetical protein [Lederbergia galactosidilytica]|uniref:Uncharacterized protein n=1 Tax=Lederbergia galactosidilytica TaxID=217031 RepID=A0A177ZXW7_9BACI|nr:hypothetical protein [Lederbergia galactosidilytica]OAK72694.1 hypothetical protein ABB05_07505 [Lederbergia galactosidilytica]
MSFVSVIATKKFITVMSDGLAINTETGEEIDQRYKKFHRISKKQFIAFAGNSGLAEEAVRIVGYNNEERDLASIAVSIREQLIKKVPPNIASCQLILGGLEKRKFVIYSFNNDPNRELLFQEPIGDDPVYSFLSDSSNGLNLDKEINKIYPKYGFNTPTKTLKIQKELNNVVADVDPSVNKITFNLTIRK